MSQETNIRLLIADDHEVARYGIKAMLEATDIKVVAEASTVADVLQLAAEKDIDVVLMESRFSDGDGLNALGHIKLGKPKLPVILFSKYDNPTWIARAVAMDASGYLLKNCTREALIAAIKTAATGENTWTRDELRRVSGAIRTLRITSDIEVSLTQREAEVLRHLARGLTNKDIAKELTVSYETIKEHVQHILRKIGLTDRTQAAVWAVRKGLA